MTKMEAIRMNKETRNKEKSTLIDKLLTVDFNSQYEELRDK